MKFDERALDRLSKAVRNLNKLDLGDLELPERLGLSNKDGNVEAIAFKKNGRYCLELVDATYITAHEEEVNKQDTI